ncbi:MAG TPA: hypothetical protein VE133_19295 [Candidatus Sulfotelmatobacter sp.]|nr:hypothetical protein [Candidatus Sulfotelmatobacter sp.]
MTNLFLRAKITALFTVSVFALLLSALPLSAQSAGYDLLQTGSGASVDLSSMGLGTVPLQGQSVDSSLGTTDTIMHRTKDIAGSGSTPVEVTALFMKSTKSVTFNGQQVDVYVTLNNSGGKISASALPQPDSLSPSGGTVTVRDDGTFDSNITINADLIFVRAGASVKDSANYVGTKAAPAVTLTSSGSSWNSAPPSGYPSSTTFPSGGFYPRPVHNGPHPVIPSTCNTVVSPAEPQQPVATVDSRATNQTTSLIAVRACETAVTAQ